MQQANSKQEFFTLDTRITIQRGNIYHKYLKYNEHSLDNSVFSFGFLLCVLGFAIYTVIEEKKYFWILQAILVIVWMWPYLEGIYKTLFVKTWKSIIPLKDIKNITTKPLENGLETEVTLHLSSGRRRFYTFRNAEGQMERFIAAVSEQAPVSPPVVLQ